MTLPARMFRDPAIVYEDKEAHSCKGCAHEETVQMFGKRHDYCKKGQRHGWRCKKYQERASK